MSQHDSLYDPLSVGHQLYSISPSSCSAVNVPRWADSHGVSTENFKINVLNVTVTCVFDAQNGSASDDVIISPGNLVYLLLSLMCAALQFPLRNLILTTLSLSICLKYQHVNTQQSGINI